MELLSPTHPPGPAGYQFHGFSPATNFRHGFDRRKARMAVSQLPEIVKDAGGKVHVAVGKSFDKSVELLRWAFQRFGSREICVVHVHQPSPLIPTPLGKLPANHANSKLLSAYRREERRQMKNAFGYLNICCQSKVKASVIATEAAQVKKGIVDLVNKYGIRKLVMGAELDNCMKVKQKTSKASYAARNAPEFCDIWFVSSRGKLVWTRDASVGPSAPD
ncbi:Ubiquitin--protein ligase [Bertholletia excelsa]